MNLKEWRRGRQDELTLPSGLTVTVRRVSVLDLAGLGLIPAPLTATVNKLIEGGQRGKQFAVDLGQFPEFIQLINVVVRAAVIAPPIADIGDDEHLGIEELPVPDRLAIFNFTNAEAARLQPFPQGAGQPVRAAQPGQRVRGKAK